MATQPTHLLSKGSSGHSELTSFKRMAYTSLLIHQAVFDGYFTDCSTADVDACSDNELVDVENQKNEVRFNMVLIQVTFESLTNRLCKRDPRSSRVLMAIFTMLKEVS